MLQLIRLEWRQLVRERLALAVLIVGIACCALAFVNGRALLFDQIAARQISDAENTTTIAKFREGLTKPTLPADAILRAQRLSLPVTAPPPPLADFSAGRADTENYSTLARLRARPDTLFKRTQLDNPELLARGSFDLGFVAVVIVPLLLIALGFGLFASDRDSGAARLVLAQGGSVTRVLAARSIARVALVLAPVAVTALVLLLTGPELAGRASAALHWLLIAVALAAFWWAVILLVNSLRITAETAALALVGLWTVLTLVLPALIFAGAQLAYPAPSRFTEIATARSAEIGATAAYENDHANLASDDFAGRLASARKSAEIGRRIDTAITPVTARFDAALAAQQHVVESLRFLSPPLVAGEALASAGGADGRAQIAFRAATADYLTRLKTSLFSTIDAGTSVDLKTYDALPRFTFVRPQTPIFAPLLFLTAVAGALMWLAARRYRRIELD